MIITKTPYRISFFGGGTDFEEYFSQYGGEVVGSTIDKYCYVSIRSLQKFFDHKYRISWSKIENVKKISDINHPTVKGLLRYYNLSNEGLEIHYDGDLPGNSGIGSSSSFCIGLIKALNQKFNFKFNKKKLASEAYHIESNVIGENVGMQDQVWASYGGLNSIKFNKSNFIVRKLNINKNIKDNLQKNLLMFYSGKSRFSDKIEKDKKKKIVDKIKFYHEIKKQVNECKKILSSGKNLNEFGLLLNEYWNLKKSLSTKVSSNEINEIYSEALIAGALGGKLLGSGGGGFFVFYVPISMQRKVRAKLHKLEEVKFKFSEEGSSIIFSND